MSETPPPFLPPRRKLAVEQPLGGSNVRRGAVWVYAALTLSLVGVALYMALVEQRELASGYVAGPAIGALWFGLRLFMVSTKRQ